MEWKGEKDGGKLCCTNLNYVKGCSEHLNLDGFMDSVAISSKLADSLPLYVCIHVVAFGH